MIRFTGIYAGALAVFAGAGLWVSDQWTLLRFTASGWSDEPWSAVLWGVAAGVLLGMMCRDGDEERGGERQDGEKEPEKPPPMPRDSTVKEPDRPLAQKEIEADRAEQKMRPGASVQAETSSDEDARKQDTLEQMIDAYWENRLLRSYQFRPLIIDPRQIYKKREKLGEPYRLVDRNRSDSPFVLIDGRYVFLMENIYGKAYEALENDVRRYHLPELYEIDGNGGCVTAFYPAEAVKGAVENEYVVIKRGRIGMG